MSGVDLTALEAALRTHEKRDQPSSIVEAVDAVLAVGIHQQIQSTALVIIQPFVQTNRRKELGDTVAATLLAGMHDDPAPVLVAACGALPIEPDDAAACEQRDDARRSQLYCFLNGVVGSLAAADSLGQTDRDGRLSLNIVVLADADNGGFTANVFNGRGVLTAKTVEQFDRCTGSQAQHTREMVVLIARELQTLVAFQRLRNENPRFALSHSS